MEINLNTLIILLLTVAITLCVIGLVTYCYSKKINKKMSVVASSKPSNVNLDFDKDIIFLNKLIEDYVTNSAILLKIKGIDYVNSKEIKAMAGETAICVYSRISDNYKQRMSLYFSEKGFNDYLNDKVVVTIISLSAKIIGQEYKK